MRTKHLFKNVRTLAIALTLCAAFAAAVVGCKKDEGPGPAQKFKMTITCTQKETNNEYTRFDVVCVSEKSVYSIPKYFYVDTVPYSGVRDTYQNQWREGETGNDIYKFRPKRNPMGGSAYDEREGEMVVTHPFNSGKKYYIGAYVLASSGSLPDTIWSEPFVYDAPVNPSIGATYKLTGLTANSATFTLKFSREVTSEEFLYLESYCHSDADPDEHFKILIPFEGKINEMKVTFDNLIPSTHYASRTVFTTIDGTDFDTPVIHLDTPAE